MLNLHQFLATYDATDFEEALEALQEEVMDAVVSTPCPHGCQVEPDGSCPHGYPAWSVLLGLC